MSFACTFLGTRVDVCEVREHEHVCAHARRPDARAHATQCAHAHTTQRAHIGKHAHRITCARTHAHARALSVSRKPRSAVPVGHTSFSWTGSVSAPARGGSGQGVASGEARKAHGITVCAYLSDVEGNLDFFEAYVAKSRILEWADAARSKLKFKRTDAMFVFGGDSQDKGIGDMRFTKLLLALKEEYPDRVEFIIGNRDANKLRLASELQEECIKDAAVLTDTSFPYWDPAEKRVTPQMFLDTNPDDNGGKANTAANRLRYMLKHTMGADGAFERRREELSIIQQCKKEVVSDEAVVESYRNEVDPAKEGDNFMLKYLQHGKLAYVFGSNLFVHGAVSAKNVGTVPGSTTRSERVHAWAEALNAWSRKEVAAFESDPYSGKNGRDRKGSGLMDYGVPGGNGGATVVYDHNLSNGNGKHLAPEVRQFLRASGITNVISGHQPHGDCPLVIRSGQVTAICADTSYSQMGHKSAWGVDNRGQAVCEVLLYVDGASEVHGVLADGSPFGYTLGGPGGDKFVGRQLSDGYWVKAKTAAPNPEYVLVLGEGFKLTVSRKSEADLLLLADADFTQPEWGAHAADAKGKKWQATRSEWVDPNSVKDGDKSKSVEEEKAAKKRKAAVKEGGKKGYMRVLCAVYCVHTRCVVLLMYCVVCSV